MSDWWSSRSFFVSPTLYYQNKADGESRIQHLRDLRDFTGVTFKIKEPTDITGAEVYQLACVPFGFAAVAAKTS